MDPKGALATDEDVRAVYDAHGGELYRFARRSLGDSGQAEEAVQEAFLRAWRFRDALPGGAAVQPWLYRVVVNACLSKLRADRSRGLHQQVEFSDDLGRAGEDAAGDPHAHAEAAEASGTVIAALAALPEHLRVVVVLRYFAQLSEKEIADVIKRRPGTVKSRLHEARTRLGADVRLAALAGAGGSAPVSEVGQ